MVGLATWGPIANVAAFVVGYAIAGGAFVMSRTNTQSLQFLGAGVVLIATTFLGPFLSRHWIDIPNILSINYLLLFGGYGLIGCYIVSLHEQ